MEDKVKKTKIRWRGPTKKKYYRILVERPIKLVTHKVCPKCKEKLPANCFTIDNGAKDGLSFYCKMCDYFEVRLKGKERFNQRYQEYKKRRDAEEKSSNSDLL